MPKRWLSELVAIRQVMTHPERQARRVSAEIAVENARAAVIDAELPREGYLRGRLAGAAYLAVRRNPPAPKAEDLSTIASAWSDWERRLALGEYDAPAPGHPEASGAP